MDVIRDRQIAVLTERNLQFLVEQVRAARSRFEVGEGTRTDVAQADASRSRPWRSLPRRARRQLPAQRSIARSSARIRASSTAQVRRRACRAASTRRSSIAAAEHPAILANKHLVDASGFSVKSAEGALLPQIVGVGPACRTDYSKTVPGVCQPQRLERIAPTSARRSRCRSILAAGRRRRCASARNLSARRASRSMSPTIRSAQAVAVRLDAVPGGARKGRREPRTRLGRAAGAQRRHRGAQCRPAHDPRRSELAGGCHHRPDQPDQLRARPCRRELCHPFSHGPAERASAWSPGGGIQAERALRRRQGQVVRPADT